MPSDPHSPCTRRQGHLSSDRAALEVSHVVRYGGYRLASLAMFRMWYSTSELGNDGLRMVRSSRSSTMPVKPPKMKSPFGSRTVYSTFLCPIRFLRL